jgi:hypothetical protein
VRVRGGVCEPAGVLVHFALPPVQWAQSLVYACSTFLFFRNAAEIERWCAAHAFSRGAALGVQDTLDFARRWFGTSLAQAPRHRSRAEAQAIFDALGLRDLFWSLQK